MAKSTPAVATKKVEQKVESSSRDELLDSLAQSLNKNVNVAFFLDDENDSSQVTEFVSSGNPVLDVIMSNRPNGGFPIGRITELQGLSSSGKSLLSGHILAETQKRGGVAVYIDTEYSVDPTFLTAIGVDTAKLMLINTNTVEAIFDNIETIVNHVRKSSKNRLVTIVVDSVAAATTEKELASDHGQEGYATGKAIAISKAMRKVTELIAKQRIAVVFVNQLRQKVGFVGLGDQYCVDPHTTRIQIKHREYDDESTVTEYLSLADFSRSFLLNEDFNTPVVYDISDFGIKVNTGAGGFRLIKSFVVKPTVPYYYTDGELNGTADHRIFVSDTEEIKLKDHPDFHRVDKPMQVVDIEVDGEKYIANNRVNHNTTSGGMGIGYHSSIRLRLRSVGQIKIGDEVVGIKTKASVIKNRMGPPAKSTEFNIFFDSGIDKYSNWLDRLIDKKFVRPAKKEKAPVGTEMEKKKTKKQLEEDAEADKKAKTLQFTLPAVDEKKDGEVITFERKDFVKLLTDRKDVYDYLYTNMCNSIIMKYKEPTDAFSDDMKCDLEDASSVEV